MSVKATRKITQLKTFAFVSALSFAVGALVSLQVIAIAMAIR